ncbi:MAG: TraR/DksA family transcriptional regulator [Paraburkholderia sp.]|nr:MAG: TraR/DksA family transcriptional regulator [Paraburkholderia sp.]
MRSRSSPLDRTELKALRRLLLQSELAIEAGVRTEAARRAEQPYAELTGVAPDEGDAATADLLVDVDHAVIGMQLERLKDIQAARERMRKHQYGICADCSQEIGFERLCAYPTAKRCARCQALHEHTYASARGSVL